jgi:hypothetical protein
MGYPKRYGCAIEDSREPLNSTPMEMPMGYEAPESLESMVARMLHEDRVRQSAQGYDSPEEADDFEDEDPDFLLDMSRYELPETVPEVAVAYDQLDPVPDPKNGANAPENSSQEVSMETGTPDATPPADQ